MKLSLMANGNGYNFQWNDLKTVKGYLNRLVKYNIKATEINISIWNGYACLKYLAIKSSNEKFWDYRTNEFNNVSELKNVLIIN